MTALSEHVEQFLDHLRVERKLSYHTLTNYRRDLSSLSEVAKQNGIDRAKDIAAQQIRKLISLSHRRGLSGRSQQRTLSAIRTFFE